MPPAASLRFLRPVMSDYLHFLRDFHPWAMRVWFFGFGACVGSFLNVCILRIPAAKSIVFPGSHCACGKPIAWYDNIPILSWFILRGQARCCGRKFSIRYSLIEAVTACTYLWLWMSFSPTSPALAITGMIFFALLLLGAMVDLDLFILPDITTIGGLLAGLTLSLLWPQIHGLPPGAWNWLEARHSLLIALTGAVAGAGVVYWIGELGNFFLRRPSMGYGDMLLMGCVGAFCGWQGTLLSIFGGATLACLFIVPMKMFAKKQPDPVVETATENSTESDEPSPLGRRIFEMDYILVLAAIGGALAWLIHHGVVAYTLPGLGYLGIIFVAAAMKRQKLVLHEGWLLLAVIVGIIISGAFPGMYDVPLSGIWFVDAFPGAVLSSVGATIGAGLALWLLEFANLIRFCCFPPPAITTPVDDFNQIWGEGYLLLFGGVGAFCGWRAAVVSAATFAVAGILKGAFYFLAAQKIEAKASSAAKEKDVSTSAESEPPINASGLEVPFGPWLALAGFLYFAWPWLHDSFDRYLDVARSLAMGEPPK